MALELHEEWKYFLVAISWLTSLVTFIVCVYGTVKAIIHIQETNPKGNPKKHIQITLIVVTLGCMYIFTMCSICDSIGFPYWSGLIQTEHADHHNLNSYLMWNVFWCIGKLMQYVLYVMRLYSVFRGTKYQTATIMYILIVVLLVGQFAASVAWVYYYNIQWLCCQIWNENQYEILTIIAWAILVIDIILTSLIIGLFLLSMKKLLMTITKYMVSTEINRTNTTETSAVGKLPKNEEFATFRL